MRLTDQLSPQYPNIPLQTESFALLYFVRPTHKAKSENAYYSQIYQ
jgi:hypothetical protein